MKHNNFHEKNNLEFLIEGNKYYKNYLDLIESATLCIHLQTYIFTTDYFGQQVQDALIRAAQRGVKIYILVDSVGSHEYSKRSEQQLLSENIYFCRFNGFFNFKFLYQWGRRLHHKILIVDQIQAIVGGINVTTSGYNHPQILQQLDFAIYMTGNIVLDLLDYCKILFFKSYHVEKNLIPHPIKKSFFKIKSGSFKIQLCVNDWVLNKHQITQQYLHLIKNAKTEITIINSYFFPHLNFMNLLLQARKRGVRVRLILPQISDWSGAVLATQYLYKYFLEHDIEIYEWNKSILHGKLATVDGKYSTIGSFNLNYTSFYQNLELNINIESTEFTQNIDLVINDLIDIGCQKIEYSQLNIRNTFKLKILRFVCYMSLSLVAKLSVLFTHQETRR